MKLYCNVVDSGSTYLVIDAFSTNTHINFSTGKLVIEINDVATYNAISKFLLDGKIVHIPKNVDVVKPSDLIVEKGKDKLSLEKEAAFSQMSNLVNRRLGNIYNVDFFEFAILNNQLLSQGYSITGDTKEDQYLAILDTGDDALISTLQSFLEVQNKISEYQNIYDSFKKAMDDINEATDANDVIFIKNQFLSKFN